MKKVTYGLAVITVVLSIVILFGINNQVRSQEREAAEAAQAPELVIASSESIIADAVVVPIRESDLSLATSGIVRAVLVEEGDIVQAGAPLLQLEDARQQAVVAQAEANVRNAELQLAELRLDPRAEEIARYEAAIASAEASMRKLYDGPSEADVTVARADLAKAEAELRQAQSDYDKVAWSNDISMLPQATALERATNDYVAAQARYDGLFADPTASDIAAAQAQVDSSRADLDNLLAGARDETIAAVEASVAEAKAVLQDATASLEQTLLTAPFEGTIAAVNLEVGEQVSAGMAVIQLADTSQWLIETEDLTELDVVNIERGDRAEIRLDALADTTLAGQVKHIKPLGENNQGDITYTVMIELNSQKEATERLRWNMSAEAIITADAAGRAAAARSDARTPTTVLAAPIAPAGQDGVGLTQVEALSEPPERQEVNRETVIVDTGGSNLNVRSGPGTEHAIVGKAEAGALLTVISQSADDTWTLIKTVDAQLGWVSSRYLKTTSEPNVVASAGQTFAVSRRQQESERSAGPLTSDMIVPISDASRPLVFQTHSGGTIYAYDFATGEHWPLATGMDPAISPDSQRVAFVRDGGEHGLYTIGIDGHDERLIFGGGERLRAPSWSPDGQHIVFSRYTGEFKCRQIGSSICLPDNEFLKEYPLVGKDEHTLSRVNLNGEGFRDIPSLTSAVAPEWSEDGIVYQSSSGIQATGDTPDSQDRPVIAKFSYEDPDWHAGGRIVFQSREGNHREIFTVNPDGSDLRALTRPLDLLAREYPQNVSPTWSPDGSQIAYLSNRGPDSSAGAWAIWVMNADGSNQRPLPLEFDFEYSFSGEQMLNW